MKPSSTIASIAVIAGLLIAGCDRAAEDETSSAAHAQMAENDAGAAISISAVSVDRDEGAYKLSWNVSAESAPVRIEVADAPDAKFGEGALIGEGVTATSFTWTPEDMADDGRKYFILTPEGGESAMAALRLLPLEGGRNFRDLGGYPAAEGKVVRWGHVYRSGRMSNLTTADYQYLSGLGIEAVCDFRNQKERTDEPTNWSGGKLDYVTFPDVMDLDSSALGEALRSPDATPEDMKQAMMSLYLGLAEQHATMYAEMFDRLAIGDVPLAFNCTAGKDRTGVAAGLLLTALGVPRELVLQDYALSETFVDYMAEMEEDVKADGADNSQYAWMMQMPRELLAPLLRSDPDYLAAAFAGMEERYGSVEEFLRQKVDVTDEELAAIRAELLE